MLWGHAEKLWVPTFPCPYIREVTRRWEGNSSGPWQKQTANTASRIWLPDEGTTAQCIALHQELLTLYKSLQEMKLITCFFLSNHDNSWSTNAMTEVGQAYILSGTEQNSIKVTNVFITMTSCVCKPVGKLSWNYVHSNHWLIGPRTA